MTRPRLAALLALAAAAAASLAAPAAAVFCNSELFSACSAGSTDWSTCTSINEIKVDGNADAQPFSCLSNLEAVNQKFSVRNSDIEDFTGLENLDTFGGDVDLYNLQSLTVSTLAGVLGRATEVGGDVDMEFLPAGVTTIGFSALQRVHGSFRLRYVLGITSMASLEQLQRIDGAILMQNLAALESLDGLGTLHTLGSTMSIGRNNKLANLDGLGNLLTVGGDVVIFIMPLLESVKLCSLPASIAHDATLTSLPLVHCGSLDTFAARFDNDDTTGCNATGGEEWTCSAVATECAADATWPDTLVGTQASLSCGAGFTGTRLRDCLDGGVWDDEVSTCAPVTHCAANGGWPETAVESTATLACEGGLVGDRTRRCSTGGVWGGEITTACREATECEADGDWPETPVETTASLSCGGGFTGTRTRRCNAGGAWSAEGDTCEEITQCAASGDWPSTAVETDATLPCGDAFTGTRTRRCNAGGAWSAETPDACVARTACEADAGWPGTAIGETAFLACGAGFTGARSRRCLAGAAWEAESDAACSPITSCEADAGWPSTAVGATAALDCPEGAAGSRTRACGELGVWASVEGECADIVECAADAGWPVTAVGATASRECAAPLSSGTRSRLCEVGGAWATPDEEGCSCPDSPRCLGPGASRSAETCECECADGRTHNATTGACACDGASGGGGCDGGEVSEETCACECADGRVLSFGACVCPDFRCGGGTFDEDVCRCACPPGQSLDEATGVCGCPAGDEEAPCEGGSINAECQCSCAAPQVLLEGGASCGCDPSVSCGDDAQAYVRNDTCQCACRDGASFNSVSRACDCPAVACEHGVVSGACECLCGALHEHFDGGCRCTAAAAAVCVAGAVEPSACGCDCDGVQCAGGTLNATTCGCACDAPLTLNSRGDSCVCPATPVSCANATFRGCDAAFPPPDGACEWQQCTDVAAVELDASGADALPFQCLERLELVRGDFRVAGSASVRRMTGLERLVEVSGSVRVEGCGSLDSLDGLDALGAVGGGVRVAGNPRLASLDGLRALRSVGAAGVVVDDNAALASVSLCALDDAEAGRVEISGSPSLPCDAASHVLGVDAAGCNSSAPAGASAACVCLADECATGVEAENRCVDGGRSYTCSCAPGWSASTRDGVATCAPDGDASTSSSSSSGVAVAVGAAVGALALLALVVAVVVVRRRKGEAGEGKAAGGGAAAAGRTKRAGSTVARGDEGVILEDLQMGSSARNLGAETAAEDDARNAALNQALPANWSAFQADDGGVYFYNEVTGVSQWEAPTE